MCHPLVAKSFQRILTPEEQARESIDGMLLAAGWLIQDRAEANIDAGRGVGGFLLAVHDYISKADEYKLDKDEKCFLMEQALSGVEIVDGAARLCAMNLFLHGIGGEEPVAVRDALSTKGSV